MTHSDINQNNILTGLNKIRRSKNLKELVQDNALNEIAVSKVKTLCKAQILSHNVGSKNWKSWFPKNNKSQGENLARYYDNTDHLIQAWVKSPSHYQIIVESDFMMIGIGIVDCDKQNYIVTNFSN